MEAAFVFLAQFVYILLLGFQQLNVMGKHYTSAATVSLALGSFGYYLTAEIAAHQKAGMGGAVWCAYVAGGPAGIVCSMWLHPRIRKWLEKK
ncbi:MAG: hypothetical protein KGL39_34840 [Patescibacteria group bacterium]|nr:hypothetical protein [Patescibacteria group bacterium]